MSVSDASFGLGAVLPEPSVGEGETLAAMIVLFIVDPDRAPVLRRPCNVRHAIRYADHQFREMQHRVGVMADAKKEHLAIEIMHAAGGTCGNMRRKRKWVDGDHAGIRSDSRESVAMIASLHAGQSPEHVRDGAEIRRGR